MQAQVAAEQFIDVDGTAVRYLESGSGPPLLLVHGLGQSSTAWLRAIPALAADWRVFAPDLPGFGGSPSPASPGSPAYGEPDYFAEVIDRFIDRTTSVALDAVGHSAGALMLLLLAARFPPRFQKIVLVDPAGFSRPPAKPVAFMAGGIASLLVRAARSRRMRRALYATAFYDQRCVDEETVDELLARDRSPNAGRAVSEAFNRFYDYCRRSQALYDRLAGFDVPTLIVWGSDDRLFRARDVAVAQRVLPHARIEVFERCGHCPHIECPERFTAVIKEFLASS